MKKIPSKGSPHFSYNAEKGRCCDPADPECGCFDPSMSYLFDEKCFCRGNDQVMDSFGQCNSCNYDRIPNNSDPSRCDCKVSVDYDENICIGGWSQSPAPSTTCHGKFGWLTSFFV